MPGRILVVDDNRLNLKLAADVLELDGYVVTTAADAEQALQRLQEMHPDLILMDIALPGMDGLTLTRRLKADPRYANTPIVALTAFAMKGDDEKALQAGCSGYITKPIDTRQLGRQVEQFLQQSTGPRVKVMVVEDDRVDLKLAGTVLEVSGHLVLSSRSAEAAVAAIAQDRPDVILLDLQLPGMDGLSFVRLLKASEATRDVPVVAVTAFPDRYREQELLAAGCAAYVTKPINTRELARQLEQAAAKGAPP
ncbi:response regulator [Caldimonas brevitalea]|uniref:Two-component response regulator n=1 Tax=Caldimonas brevitalea TaxID=413882 RepID=A0A0G3BFH1_9BURK|nr:response regulator [Caldimonas brevitalea]AKJ26718.1 two-component response regulator [Caldimonas brevitalea]